MTIIATGNPSLLKPGCPCCGGCCPVILDYAIGGLSKIVVNAPPTLCFSTQDCEGNILCGEGYVEGSFHPNSTVSITADQHVHLTYPGSETQLVATFAEWQITFPFTDPSDQEEQENNAPYNTPIRDTSVTLGARPCGFLAIAVYTVSWPAPTYLIRAQAVYPQVYTGYTGWPDPGTCLYHSWTEYMRAVPSGIPSTNRRYHWYYRPIYGGPEEITFSFRANDFPWHKRWWYIGGPYCYHGVDCRIVIDGMRMEGAANCSEVPHPPWYFCTSGSTLTIDANCVGASGELISVHAIAAEWEHPKCSPSPPYEGGDCEWD